MVRQSMPVMAILPSIVETKPIHRLGEHDEVGHPSAGFSSASLMCVRQ
jgi:hypothetical protein